MFRSSESKQLGTHLLLSESNDYPNIQAEQNYERQEYGRHIAVPKLELEKKIIFRNQSSQPCRQFCTGQFRIAR